MPRRVQRRPVSADFHAAGSSAAYCIGCEYAMFCMCRALTLPSPCVTLAFLALCVPAGATAPIAFGRGDARACLADLCCCAVGALDAMISHPMRGPGGHGG